MHRLIPRVFRGALGKLKDHDGSTPPPALDQEDFHQQKREEYGQPPPKHNSMNEACALTSGLIFAWSLSERRRILEREESLLTALSGQRIQKKGVKCPWATYVLSTPGPTLRTVLSVRSTRSTPTQKSVPPGPVSLKNTSIAVTPFIEEDFSLLDSETAFLNEDDGDDSDGSWASSLDSGREEVIPKFATVSTPIIVLPPEHDDIDPETKAEAYEITGEILSQVGSFYFLKTEEEKAKCKIRTKSSRNRSPVSHQKAIDLLKHGGEMGSRRALYNLGVAYERLNEETLAKKYFQKAADFGHPVALYNCAVFAVNEGRAEEGRALLEKAADAGIPEAISALKIL